MANIQTVYVNVFVVLFNKLCDFFNYLITLGTLELNGEMLDFLEFLLFNANIQRSMVKKQNRTSFKGSL